MTETIQYVLIAILFVRLCIVEVRTRNHINRILNLMIMLAEVVDDGEQETDEG